MVRCRSGWTAHFAGYGTTVSVVITAVQNNGRVVLIGMGAIEFSVVMILLSSTGRRGARQDPVS